MNRSRADLFAMQDRIPERSTEQKLADYRALRADQIRLARSWRNSPVIRDGHLKAARMLQADIMQLHAVELATALEPGPDEAAEIAALLEPETNAELRQGQNLTLNLPTRHVTREWAKRHLNVETNGFEVELDTAFGKGNWTLADEKRTQEEARY